MPRMKPETPRNAEPPSVMVRSTGHMGMDEPIPPTAGELAREIPGVQMQPAFEQASAARGTGSTPASMPQGGSSSSPSASSSPAAAMPGPRATQTTISESVSAVTGNMPRPGGQQPSAAVPGAGSMQQTAAASAQAVNPSTVSAMPMPVTGAARSAAPTSQAAPPIHGEQQPKPVRQAHVLQKRDGADLDAAMESGAAAAPAAGFAYPATLRGSTAHFNVYYDPSLGANGPTIADGVLASCEAEFAALQGYFDGITPGGLPFNIIVVSGLGGAFHYGCSAVDLYCDGDTSASPDINHTRMLVVAEEVEVFEAAQARGWACGASNGEGLSRVLATQLYPAELNGFESASSWLNAAGRPDYVSVTDNSDRNYVSTGCATLFLNFLRHQLRFSWQQITRAAAPTLAQTYTNLTGRTDAYSRFKNLLQAYYPEGTPVSLSSDNVFPLPGVMNVFAKGSDGAVWHLTQTNPNNGWSAWASLGGWVDSIAACQNDDLRLEIFCRGMDGAVWHNWQTSPNGAWSGWGSLGGWVDIIRVEQNADGRMEIFARGADGAVWHNWQTAPSNGWSGWASLGGWIDMLTVSKNSDGRMELFARGSDGAVWHNWQTARNSGWSGWYSLGGWVDIIEVGQNADGRMELFCRGMDGALWHNWQTSPNGAWSGWASMGGWIDHIAVGQNDDGRMEVFARGMDGALWHNWQTAPNGGWSGWASMGGWIDRLTIANNADGRMEVFARGSDSAVWHNWQTAPSNGWSGWASMGGWIDVLETWPGLPGH